MILSQMAMDLHIIIMCYFHQFWGSLGSSCWDAWPGFLQKCCCRACSCRYLAEIFSTNSHACVLHPNLKTMQILYRSVYIKISKYKTTLTYWAKIYSGKKLQECLTVGKNLNQYAVNIVSSQIIIGL